MTKEELAKSIGNLEADLSNTETERRKTESKLGSAKRNRTAGAAVLLIGILGFLFLNGIWPLWVFLVIIGVLTLVTAIVRQSSANQEMAVWDTRITRARAKLAELRALITAPS